MLESRERREWRRKRPGGKKGAGDEQIGHTCDHQALVMETNGHLYGERKQNVITCIN